MNQRDTLLVLVGVLGAAVVGLLLFVAILVRQPERANVSIGRQAVPTPRPLPEVARRLPAELRFLVPIIPLQRGLSEGGREAAGLLLVLLLTGGSLVLAREQVVRVHAGSAGGIGDQARIFGIGVGVLIMLASGTLLAVALLLRTLAGMPPPGVLFGLQTLFAVFALIVLVVGALALLGFAAASWRLGVLLLGLPAWRRFGERVPTVVATLLAATLIYFLGQVPYLGPIIGGLALAYSLGAFVRSRIAKTGALPPA